MTVDHVLFVPSPASSQETAYTALSRGRYSNHIFPIINSGWEEALGVSKAHTFASDQHPSLDHNDRLAERGCQRAAEWDSDVRARLLAAHQASRAPSAGAIIVTPSRDAECERARRERQQREQSDRQPGEDRRRGRAHERGRNDGPRIGM